MKSLKRKFHVRHEYSVTGRLIGPPMPQYFATQGRNILIQEQNAIRQMQFIMADFNFEEMEITILNFTNESNSKKDKSK